MPTFTWDLPIVAPPETVFELIADHRGYADLTPLRKVVLEREGTPAPNGVGAIRSLHAVGPPLREEITEYVENERLAYKLLSGLPVKDHSGSATITPGPGGSRLAYRVDTTPAIPVVGHVAAQATKVAVDGLLKAVKKEAERRASAAR